MADEDLEEGFEFESTSRSEYVICAANALQAIDGIDEMVQTEAGRNRIKRIRFKSVKIIDNIINELYDELFEDTDVDLP
jgi:hypothetical protein